MSRLIGKWIRNGYEAFEQWRKHSNSRRQADEYRQRIAESKPHPFVDGKIIKRAKEESKARFGDPGHWHWLALYAELREEYVEGWLPMGIYSSVLIPFLNPKRLAYLSTYKSFDHKIFPEFAATPIGRIVNGCYYTGWEDLVTKEEFLNVVKCHRGEVVIKEDGAASGEGIRFISAETIESVQFQTDKSYLVQPLFQQHRSLKLLYPQSVNTLRISTYLGPDGTISVKHKILRTGSGGNRIVNAGDQDIDIYIDDDGRISRGAVDGIGRMLDECHPDTGFQYRDLAVPSVREAMAVCKQAHTRFPYLRFIAWDLYINKEGEPRMIEWNAVNPSIWVHEARIGPLWSNEEINEAMEGIEGVKE